MDYVAGKGKLSSGLVLVSAGSSEAKYSLKELNLALLISGRFAQKVAEGDVLSTSKTPKGQAQAGRKNELIWRNSEVDQTECKYSPQSGRRRGCGSSEGSRALRPHSFNPFPLRICGRHLSILASRVLDCLAPEI